MSTTLSSLSVQQLRKAAKLKEKIQVLEKELGQLFGSFSQPLVQAVAKRKWKMSAAGRAKIAAAARARWARVKAKNKA